MCIVTNLKKIKFKPYILFSFFVIIFSCKEEEKPTSLFQALDSKQTNIKFKNIIPENELTNSFVYEYVYNGGGVAVGDINNDGLNDIYFTSNLGDNKLYLNKGNLEFQDITEESGTNDNKGWSTGVNMIDINNDNLLDIYVCKSGPFDRKDLLANKLFINKGNNENGIPVFEEAASSFGFTNIDYSIQSAFFDYDQDGDLDMYLLNHNPQTFSELGTEGFSYLGDKFFVNENGKFVDKTKEVGIYSNAISYGLGIGISDLNLDGWPDMYVSNDYFENDYMYINQKDGTFKEVIKEATNHISTFSMGNDIADFNNDGYTDIITLDMVSEDNYGMKASMASMDPQKFYDNVKNGKHYQYMYNSLQKNSTYVDSTGVPFFSDIGQMTGISNTDWSWAPLFADFDNDGLKDIFITNGIKRDFRNKDFYNSMQDFIKQNADALTNPKKINSLIQKTPNRPYKNYFYKNNDNLSFSKATDEWLPNASKSYSNGAAYADLDNDGDLEIIINNVDQEATILKNNAVEMNSNNFLQFQFKNMPKNTKGIGAKVLLYTSKGKQIYENYVSRGYQSSIPSKIHIGIGDLNKIDSVLVVWSDNKFQKFDSIKINEENIFNYNMAIASFDTKPAEVRRQIFSRYELTNKITHKENDFDDYKEQILLPHKMSQFGPSLAVADVNNDNLEDVFIGGATGYESKLFIQKSDGSFQLTNNPIFIKDKIHEDIDALFFDIDNDNDLDLYVVSGGNEFKSGSANYQDRIYINNGSGNFSKLSVDNTNFSGSVVKAKDFDNDGDIDVFVGGRHVPHQYPLPASSKLFENRDGKLVDVTDEKAAELKDIGMVTDAIWTDYDNDNDLDLMVVGEWMPITIFKNTNGKFSKIETPSLAKTKGWWFSIEQGDFDKDGDTDYIVGNLGLNYKYKTTSDKPFDIYYKDFDGNGKEDIVLGYYNFGKHYPVRGFSCSSSQVPSLKKSIKKYDIFASMELKDVYGEENIADALHLTADTFTSSYLENLGNGEFKVSQLPIESQFSSINDILIDDFNQDGNQDVLLVGNLFVSEIETPRNDAGTGTLLLGDGKNNFKAVPYLESGFFANKDAKKMKFLKSKKSKFVLVANNNDVLQVFKLKNQ